MNRVHSRLASLLRNKFEVPADRIVPTATLGELDLDSLAVVELYVTLQEEWGIPLDDSGASAELTVAEVARAVSEQLALRDEPVPHDGPGR
ncbi:acyl carrier protein [Streptomyces sp. LaBMicrA B280]|uniref:acyl carrier protein n=1 Tax=Streptomyces sp. LaBMicrA B280 TaxID=3391001 RepID=UPI003BA560AE